ncbi:hypothetical protein SAMN04515674_103173 [Pseudarcicella hirudinis]|uniref:Uncharacterized protein n=1 Tax=Pseudarcicella hirudinis TaxID=1079859 RepID=A0A1I5QGR3_9BACT|nr:hypothetical protein [Pseudarcicella hirudinis]SFP45056.1 hypothetical protein SAMN04515674_103173 [Pseudarcicella hirudinis]
MKNSILLITFSLIISLTGCVESKKITELKDQIHRLETQVNKERQENTELSTFRFNLESQFKQKNEQYIKCQQDSRETFESLGQKYNSLLVDYNKLQSNYKTLNDTYEASKQNTTQLVEELEERNQEVSKAKAATHHKKVSKSRKAKVVKKAKTKKRRRR